LKSDIYNLNPEEYAELRRLENLGAPFVINYSADGPARLTVWLPQDWKATKAMETPKVMPIRDRYYEYGFVVKNLLKYYPPPASILDVGAADSPLLFVLASLGYNVTAVDQRKCIVNWENLHFVSWDVLKDKSPFDQAFDIVTCISTVEHFGLGRYGDTVEVDGDLRGISILWQELVPKGFMFLSVPYGNPEVFFPAHRIYNRARYRRLITGFSSLETTFFGPIDDPAVFRPCTERETCLNDISGPHYAIVCSVLQKRSRNEDK